MAGHYPAICQPFHFAAITGKILPSASPFCLGICVHYVIFLLREPFQACASHFDLLKAVQVPPHDEKGQTLWRIPPRKRPFCSQFPTWPGCSIPALEASIGSRARASCLPLCVSGNSPGGGEWRLTAGLPLVCLPVPTGRRPRAKEAAMKAPRNQPGPHRPGPSGDPIRADELLPWSALHTRLGWGPRAVSDARARGLRVLRFANRQYIKGSDVIAFLESVADQADVDQVQGDGPARPKPSNRPREGATNDAVPSPPSRASQVRLDRCYDQGRGRLFRRFPAQGQGPAGHKELCAAMSACPRLSVH